MNWNRQLNQAFLHKRQSKSTLPPIISPRYSGRALFFEAARFHPSFSQTIHLLPNHPPSPKPPSFSKPSCFFQHSNRPAFHKKSIRVIVSTTHPAKKPSHILSNDTALCSSVAEEHRRDGGAETLWADFFPRIPKRQITVSSQGISHFKLGGSTFHF